MTIYSLHKAYQFLGYLQTVLNIDESSLRGQLFANRIKNGYTYTTMAKKIGLDKSTVAHFEKNGNIKEGSRANISRYSGLKISQQLLHFYQISLV